MWEYPLQHYRSKVKMGLLRGLVAVLALLGSEKHQRVRERDKRRREKREGGSGSSGSEEEGGSASRGSGEQEEVDRRDFGGGGARRRRGKRRKSIASGSWHAGSVGNNLSREDVSLERRSNQTRSRRSGGSVAGGEVDEDGRVRLSVHGPPWRKGGVDYSWLERIRKRRRGVVPDEEKEVGASEMVLEERGEDGEGQRRLT